MCRKRQRSGNQGVPKRLPGHTKQKYMCTKCQRSGIKVYRNDSLDLPNKSTCVENGNELAMKVYRNDCLYIPDKSIYIVQFNTEKRRLLDTHAPSTQRQVTRRHRSPWYSSIALELRSMKRERRHAERRWLSTGLTIHKEIMNSSKHKISRLVSDAKSTF